MSTRGYFPTTGTAPLASLALDGGWETTAAAIAAGTYRFPASTTKASSAFSTLALSDAVAGGSRDIFFRQYQFGPIGAQTFSGTFEAWLRASENFAANFDGEPQIKVYIVSANGLTVRGTLIDYDSNTTADSHEVNSGTVATRLFPRGNAAQSVTGVTSQNGDYIIIEIGLRRTSSSNASRTGSIEFGDNSGSDLVAAEGSGSQFAPWFQFSMTVTMATSGQTIAMGQPSETDTAQPIAHTKKRTLTQTTETDTANAISHGHVVAAGRALESDTANAIHVERRRAANRVTETDTAQVVTPSVGGGATSVFANAAAFPVLGSDPMEGWNHIGATFPSFHGTYLVEGSSLSFEDNEGTRLLSASWNGGINTNTWEQPLYVNPVIYGILGSALPTGWNDGTSSDLGREMALIGAHLTTRFNSDYPQDEGIFAAFSHFGGQLFGAYNSEIKFNLKSPHTVGSITLNAPFVSSQAFSISTTGTDVTVNLAISSFAVTTTANQIVAAILADTTASAVLTCVLHATSNGTQTMWVQADNGTAALVPDGTPCIEVFLANNAQVWSHDHGQTGTAVYVLDEEPQAGWAIGLCIHDGTTDYGDPPVGAICDVYLSKAGDVMFTGESPRLSITYVADDDPSLYGVYNPGAVGIASHHLPADFQVWTEVGAGEMALVTGGASIGHATESDSANAMTRLKRKALSQVAETDTSNPVTRVKSRTLSQSSETDTANALTRLKRKALSQATETDTANAIMATRTRSTSQVIEADTAQPIAHYKTIRLSQPVESDTASAMTHTKKVVLSQPSEADTARAITGLRTRAIAQVLETDTANAMTRLKRKALSQATETDTANAMTHGATTGLDIVTEVDTARAITRGAFTSVGRVTEADTANVFTSKKVKAVSQVTETDTARAITHTKSLTLGGTLETDTANAMTRLKRATLAQAVEADTARPVLASRVRSIGQVLETDTARASLARKLRAIGQAVEEDIAQRVGAALPHLGIGAEEDSAGAIVTHRRVLRAIEVDSARPIRPQRKHGMGSATEIDTAGALGSFQHPTRPSEPMLFSVGDTKPFLTSIGTEDTRLMEVG